MVHQTWWYNRRSVTACSTELYVALSPSLATSSALLTHSPSALPAPSLPVVAVQRCYSMPCTTRCPCWPWWTPLETGCTETASGTTHHLPTHSATHPLQGP